MLLLLAAFLTLVLAQNAQFYDKSSNIGFALSTSANGSSGSPFDLYFQLSAPKSSGWGAVGTGERMDHSLMFIVYPAQKDGAATVSVRTSGGNNAPNPISGVTYTVESTETDDTSVKANIVCHGCSKWDGGALDATSSDAPWMWAAGSGKAIASDSTNYNIEKHSKNGVFFVDITATHSTSKTIPTISGNEDLHVREQPGSEGILIIIHAILLTGSFFLLFPLGAVALRYRGLFRAHWILQVAATTICILGLVVSIIFSVQSIKWTSFGAAHQVLGIIVVAVLIPQIVFGYLHHSNHKKFGGRTVVSHLHIWTGRMVIVLGMLDGVLGLTLAGLNTEAIVLAVIGLLIIAVWILLVWLSRRKENQAERPNSLPAYSARDIPLDEVNTSPS